MPIVDGAAAGNLLLTYTNITPGYCLHYVWQAYAAQGATSAQSYPTAYSAWLGSSGQHPGDYDPPAGVPVYLGPREGSNAGDVMISLGGGNCAATDWPYNGVVGVCTIQQRMAQTNRPYLGWTDNILGNPILQVQPQPDPIVEDDMGDFNTIRDDAGTISFADMWGNESILDYFDPGVALDEGIDAVQILGGGAVQVNNRQRDVINSIIANRVGAFIDRVADAVISKLDERSPGHGHGKDAD